MMKFFKIFVFVFILLFVSSVVYAEDNLNCFTIIAGKKATASNSVLIAHNEDDGGRNIFVNIRKIHSKKNNNKFIHLKNKGILKTIAKPFNFLVFEVTNTFFGDSCLNENGVVIASNACSSKEDKPVLTNGGIGYYLRKIIARRAKTAREGVKIAGDLITKFGYVSSGRSYAIADSNEGWLLQIVKGKHWIAKRIPDNEVAVISNYYTIEKIDLKDTKNYLGSPDIISYAKKRGWYKENEGKFDFAKIYSDEKNLKNMGNILRQWRATNLLSKKKYKIDERLPFSFVPRKDVKITDLFNVLRDHYEDTDYDLTDDYKNGSPNSTKNRTICTHSTQYSFVAVLRNDLPEMLNNLVWLALRRPDTNAYSPIYFLSDNLPEGYNFNIKAGKNNPYAFNTFSELSNTVDKKYKKRIKKTRKQWHSFEKYAIKQLKKKRKEFTYILKQSPFIAKKVISNFILSLEYKKWFLAKELIKELTED